MHPKHPQNAILLSLGIKIIFFGPKYSGSWRVNIVEAGGSAFTLVVSLYAGGQPLRWWSAFTLVVSLYAGGQPLRWWSAFTLKAFANSSPGFALKPWDRSA